MYLRVHTDVGLDAGSAARRPSGLEMHRFHDPDG
jgi:hypothetical protein